MGIGLGLGGQVTTVLSFINFAEFGVYPPQFFSSQDSPLFL